MDGQTLLWDVVRFSLPLGAPGRWAGKALVVPHVLGLMARRFELIKRLAEGDGWRTYLPELDPEATSSQNKYVASAGFR